MSETIGVDVGGTKVSVAVLRDGRLGEPALQPTDKRGPGELLDAIAAAVEAVRTDESSAVGLGIPSVVDFETGTARSSVNVPLQDVPIRAELTDRLGLDVYVDNDATVAALAEAWGDGRIAIPNLVMFTVGTGIGGGLVLGGRVYRGATGAAAEIGHMLVAADLADGVAEPGPFPQRGSLEAVAAGRVLDGLALDAARSSPDSALGALLAAGEEITGTDAVVTAQAGDEVAKAAIRRLGERLGVGIANAINIFDPDVVVVGGGASAAGELLLGPARETALGYVLPGVGTRTEIRLARAGSRAGVLGAALLALTEGGG